MAKFAGVNHLQVVRALEKVGYRIKRQSKHIVMHKGSSIVVIPRNNPVKPYTLLSILKAAAISPEDFKKLL